MRLCKCVYPALNKIEFYFYKECETERNVPGFVECEKMEVGFLRYLFLFITKGLK